MSSLGVAECGIFLSGLVFSWCSWIAFVSCKFFSLFYLF
jgi:hypothetical protein